VNSITGAAIEPVDIGTVARLKTNSYSIFGQGEYDITSKLTAIVGLRAIREQKDFHTEIGFFQSFNDFTVNQGPFLDNFLGTGAPYFYSDHSSHGLWAGKVQLDYHLSDGFLLYAGVNRGVKAGSYNAPILGGYLGSGGNASIPYRAETLYAYEGGFKSTWQDG